MTLGENIKKYREKAGLTLVQLAEKIGVTANDIDMWENHDIDTHKLHEIAKALKIKPSKLIADTNYQEHWELKDRLFSEENMYTFVETAAKEKNLEQTLRVLPLVKKMHEGQFRKGKDKIPYIYHPLMLSCHALALGLGEDEIIATALLHDVLEDCMATEDELPVSDDIKQAVQLLTFKVKDGESREDAKSTYYKKISENRIASIVKVLDRCNNISTMATGFSRESMVKYIDETEKYVMPVLDVVKHQYPECYNATFVLKYHMRSLLETLKRVV